MSEPALNPQLIEKATSSERAALLLAMEKVRRLMEALLSAEREVLALVEQIKTR